MGFISRFSFMAYTNSINDIVFIFNNVKSKFQNFVPYALLFKKSFIYLDKKIFEIFLWSKSN